ncbi:MAG: ABC transporter ATP-binding protein [Actinomycetia bacterium]|nr:ABC transporter ATP-binding protein [Actinomycetes bacterium]
MMTVALSLRGIGVRFNGSRILDSVDMEIARGEWLGIIGPNGAGKTTLLRAVTGSVEFDGSIAIEGSKTSTMKRRDLARSVALVPQHPVLPPGMRVVDYVLLGRTPHVHAVTGPSLHDFDVVATILEALTLSALMDRDVTTLSGGELQRAVIARALAQESPILLLDEPTTALDVGMQQEVLELVDQLRRERSLTVVSALHDLTIAAQFPDRLVMLAQGEVVVEGDGRTVLDPVLIRTHYSANVKILDDGSGGIVVVPLRSRQPTNDSKN